MLKVTERNSFRYYRCVIEDTRLPNSSNTSWCNNLEKNHVTFTEFLNATGSTNVDLCQLVAQLNAHIKTVYGLEFSRKHRFVL
jgi:hypothetical protein